MKINIFYDTIKYRLRGTKKVKELIIKVIMNEKKVPGDLNFVFTNDKFIRKINREFLNHDYYTDVIAFDTSEGDTVSGEIYISVDTIRINAKKYRVSLREEIIRVMIHGTLHLCGYDDKEEEEKWSMFERGEIYVKEIF